LRGCKALEEQQTSLSVIGAAATVSPDDRILITKVVTFSPGAKGPAAFFTGGMLCRNATRHLHLSTVIDVDMPARSSPDPFQV
jgi:hypothetical protein